MNKKGGMDQEESKKYVMNSIVPLFPDSDDVPGKRVLIKVDSGPGWLNFGLMARLKMLGFYMYPGVPNTTAVSQETDRNYRPFKTVYHQNLRQMVQVQLDMGKSMSLQPCLVAIPVFSGVDPETNQKVGECAVTAGFNKEACLKAWEKVGVAFKNTVTKACLDEPKVHKTLGDGDDEEKYNAIQSANDLAVWALKDGGFNANSMIGTLQRSKAPDPLTWPQSMERVRMLANATKHGDKHLITCGAHLMNNDMFLAAAMNERELTLKEMKREKRSRLQKYNT